MRRDATLALLVAVALGATLAAAFAGESAAVSRTPGFDSPWIDRGLQLALHLLAALLLRRVGVAVGLTARAAFAGAALFAVHPLAAAAVGTAAGRDVQLATVAALGAVLAHVETRRRQARGDAAVARGALAVALAAIAFAAHPQAALVPLALLSCDRRHRPVPWRRLGPQHAAYAAALALVWALSRLSAPPAPPIDPLDNPIAGLPPVARALSALQIAGRYLGHVSAPVALSADYAFAEVRPVAPGAGPVAATAALVLLALAAAWRLARRRTAAAFGLGFAAATFLPAANLFWPLARAMDDRVLYLPLAGLVLAAAAVWSDAAARWPRLAPRLAAALIAAFALLAIRYSWSFRHPLAIERQAARAAPRSFRALVWRGEDRLSYERLDEAEAAFRRAAELAPRHAPAHLGLARVEHRRGDLVAAERRLRDALALDPRLLPAIDLAVLVALQHGDTPRAAELWRQRLEVEPDHVATLSNLAVVEWESGRRDAAIGLWRRAAASADAPPALLLNLARALEAAGRGDEAAAYRRRAATSPR